MSREQMDDPADARSRTMVRMGADVDGDGRAFQAARDVINNWAPRGMRPWLRWQVVAAVLGTATVLAAGALTLHDLGRPDDDTPRTNAADADAGPRVETARSVTPAASTPAVSGTTGTTPGTAVKPAPMFHAPPAGTRAQSHGGGYSVTVTPTTTKPSPSPTPTPHEGVTTLAENEAANLDPEGGSRDDIFYGTEAGSRVIRSANADRALRYIGRPEMTKENCEKYGSEYYGSFKTEVLTKNDVICFVTNEGRISAVRLEQDPQPSPWQLPITYVTWS